MNDEQLFQLCKKYGSAALESRRKFTGLLPEVFRRQLFRKKGFESIYHFAAVLAGISNEQVNIALRLERKFEDKPDLKKALVEGEISVNKLARVASIATNENQAALAHKAKLLSKSALEVFVKDEKSLPGHSNPQESLPDVNLAEILSAELQKELVAMHKKGINLDELLSAFLQKHKQDIENKKSELSKNAVPAKSRYISVDVRKVLQLEHGTNCAVPNCNRPSAALHHTRRFALSRTHDPNFLAPLCKQHHEIAHAIDAKYAQKRLL